MRTAIVLAMLLTLAAWPARAEERSAPEPEQIVLELRAEGWLQTHSADVRVLIDAASPAGDLGTAQGFVQGLLGKVQAGAEWRILSFRRSRDSSGLEHWRVTAETRVPEGKLTGLPDRARAASRPGVQVSILGIDFSPTLAEREAGLAKLRVKIYRQAQAELERLRRIMSRRGFRIQRVDFVPYRTLPAAEARRLRAERRMSAATEEAKSGGGSPLSVPIRQHLSPLAVSVRQHLRAVVVLAAPAPTAAK